MIQATKRTGNRKLVPTPPREQALAVLLLAVAPGCTDVVPTVVSGDRIPIRTETVEVHLPFSAFATDLQTHAGFGSAAEIPSPMLANRWGGELDANLLIRFGGLPATISVFPPGVTSGAQTDSTFHAVRGEVVLRWDTSTVAVTSSFDFEAEAILTDWDPRTATWEFAADTVGGSTPWPEAGGGPTRSLGSFRWAPAVTDSLTVPVDSATVAEWTDPDRGERGLRVRVSPEGSRLHLVAAALRVRVRSEVNPDTVVVVDITEGVSTFVYAPEPAAAPGVLRIGGVPAKRATFRLELPETVDPGPEACARIECPAAIEPSGILYAALGLHTHPPPSPVFAPRDSVNVELRPVLSPGRLPRSPVAPPVHDALEAIPPEYFSAGGRSVYEIPMTGYLRAVAASGTSAEDGQAPTVALLVAPEPRSLEVLSFHAPGTEFEPFLRLILNVAGGVVLP